MGGRHGEHAWHVVVAKHQWAFNRTRGQNNLIGTNAVQALTRLLQIALAHRYVVLQQFHRLNQVVVMQGKRGGAGQYRHIGMVRQGIGQFFRVFCARFAIELAAGIGQQPTAHLRLLVYQQHFQAIVGTD